MTSSPDLRAAVTRLWPRGALLLVLAALVVCSHFAAGSMGGADQDPAAGARRGNVPTLPAVVQQIVHRTNAFRQAEGRKPVEPDAKLTETAGAFAEFMARTGKYGHDVDGKTPADRAKEHGYEYCLLDENIAYRFQTAGFTTEELARGFFQGWKDSPGHRKNMLDPDVTQTGVAVAHSAKTGYYYAVQLFGRPLAERIEFKLTNSTDAEVEYAVGEDKFTLLPRSVRTHQVCRPPEVTFTASKDLTIRPGKGEHYVVRTDGVAKFRVEKAPSTP